MDPAVIKAITDAGLVGGLILVVIGGFREWYVYGPAHRRIVEQLTKDRDFWRAHALRAAGIAEKAVEKVPPQDA